MADGGADRKDRGCGAPSWRSWAVSVVVAVLLSAAVTWLLGESFPGREHRPGGAGACGERSAAPHPAGQGSR